MKTKLLKSIASEEGNKIKIKGWVYTFRISGKIAFLKVRDGTGEIQAVVMQNEVGKQQFALLKQLQIETSLELEGVVKKEKRSPTGYDLIVLNLKLLQIADNFPIGKKEHGAAFLLDNRHLWLRSKRQRAIQTIRNTLIYAIYEFYADHDFTKIDTPILTPNACEGTTTLFEIDYFGNKSFLSQSGQLYLEAAIFAFNRVFDFSPVFRAEKSKTRRHLIEFWMTNAEAAFIDHEENLKIQERLIEYVVNKCLTACKHELETLERDLTQLKQVKAPFTRISYQQAIERVRQLGSKTEVGFDLGNEDETVLMKEYDRPVFVEYYPAAIKAFYMKRHPQNESLALCADLLAPEGYGEIIGGSQREDDPQKLKAAIIKHNLSLADFAWYLDLRKYGSVTHSGFGLGLERLVTWICGLKHVREAIPFPRLLNRFKP